MITFPISFWKGRTASQPPVLATIPDADYLVFQYTFNSSGGNDLDTLTSLVSPVSQGPLGYCSQLSSQFLFFGGDNTGQGTEACYVNVMALKLAYPSMTNVKLTCRANWYGTRLNGNVFITMFAYAGGTMAGNGAYGFSNSGGVLLGTQAFPTVVITVLNRNCTQTGCVGTYTYTLATGAFTREDCI